MKGIIFAPEFTFKLRGKLLRTLLTSLILFTIISSIPAQFKSVVCNNISVKSYEKFEVTIAIDKDYDNPYNPAEVNLTCKFISPSGKSKLIDGFYYVDFRIANEYGKLDSLGAASWKIRFTPDEPGEWKYIISLKDNDGTYTDDERKFVCISSNNKGFIRRSNTNYLMFDDGSQFFAIGENIGWYQRNKIYDYKKWIDNLAANGGNFIRIWMCSWATGIEWIETGLGNYSKRMAHAYELDWIMDYAAQKGIYIELCLNNHGQVSSYVNPQWFENPYNAANGGPCKNTWDFFSDSTAIKFYLQRLKYIIARWGYSPNIFSWEIFNEIEWTNFFCSYKEDIIKWHELNFKYIDSLDVYDHLISTSLGYPHENHKLWQIPGMDFTQTHIYTDAVDIESVLLNFTRDFLAFYDKPTLNGEFGLSPRNEWLNSADSAGIHIHNVLWSSLVSGALGTAMTWWWDYYIEPHNLYHYYKPLSDFVNSINFVDENFKPSSNIICETNSKADFIFNPGIGGMTRSPSKKFYIDKNGIIPSTDQLSSVLFGNEWWNSELKNPPEFYVNLDKQEYFSVIVADSGIGAVLSIQVDGLQKFCNRVERDSIYTINIPEGKHIIRLDNVGSGYIHIRGYELSNSTKALKGFISAGKTTLIGWLHNRNYNWRNVRLNKKPQPIQSGKVTIPYLPNGIYKLELIDCSSGALVKSELNEVSKNELSFNVENLNWDMAFKVTHMSGKSSEKLITMNYLQVTKNRPAPSNNLVDVKYFIDNACYTNISVYNSRGMLIKNLVDENLLPGFYTTVWNTESLEPGLYNIVKLSGDTKESVKLILD